MHSKPLPNAIVDAHHHLWRLDQGHYPWLQDEYDANAFFLGDYARMCHDFGPPEYRRRTQSLPIRATVHVEAERARDEALAETAWLHELNSQTGMPNAVVAYADFGSPDVASALEQQSAYPLVRGIRCKPKTSASPTSSVRNQPGTMQDERWLRGLALLERYGLSWDLRVPFWHLSEAADVAAQFPSLPIVLNHLGLPWDRSEEGIAAWRRGMEALARHEQVYVKLSEMGLRDAAWNTAENARLIRDTVSIFGWQRCMFASNLPVSGLNVDMPTLIDTVSLGVEDLSEAQKQAIWHDNAVRFYRIAV
ncbi:amidohydrolase family protein [Bordetella sp. 02P26C-1]|uniref:amidohydrolase family protein n=1 Tax=unclassified Bordetella TaxID=2630031 RepID=UPI0030154A68